MRRVRTPWSEQTGVEALLHKWADDGTDRHVTLRRTIPSRDATMSPIPADVALPIVESLNRKGITQLYAHQSRAFELASQRKHVVIATPTASGKSLCYNLPVLNQLLRDPSARALYLFPTKALARDQEQSLRAFMNEAGVRVGAVTYDGDTPNDARRVARQKAGVILTNPDMLHAGIMPHHAGWTRILSNLKYVVVDELHSYRGVFGSHLANVMRRLQRIARFHGSDPTFIFASATIGNPQEHAERICGESVALVDENGAPAGDRHVVVYNPPVVNAELGIRQSYIKSSVRLAQDLVRAEISTLVFGQSRNGVEVMLKYLRDRLSRDGIDPSTIHAYRGGYLPEKRRQLEASLRAGEIRCVVATNALELGIDIGALDAVVCAGYPGTIAGLWQRFGRAGRRLAPSLAVLVTSSNPIDQYMAHHPRQLIAAPVENARIDPDNIEILVQHLKCAAFELPFQGQDTYGDLPHDSLKEALGYLAQQKIVHAVADPAGGESFHWAADSYPANGVSLRSVGWDNFVVIDLEGNRTIAEMDWRSAHTMLHEQAIYQHSGTQYQVERLDYENHKAFVARVEPDYYTTAMTHTKVNVVEQDECAELALLETDERAQAGLGDVSIIEKVVGYKKIKFHTHENVGCGDVHLPEMQKHTQAFWLTMPEGYLAQRPEPRPTIVDALRGVGKAMHIVAAVGLMIDPRDLGRTLGDRTEGEELPGKGNGPGFDPTIFLYDQVAGGIGLSPRLFLDRNVLLRRARELVQGCSCEEGCPACIGPDSIGEAVPPRKDLVVELLDALGARAMH